MGFCGGSDVEAPDYSAEIAESNRIAADQLKFQKDVYADYMDWNNYARKELAPSLKLNKQIAADQFQWAQQDKHRQQSVYQPLEDRVIQRSYEMESPEYLALQEAKAKAGVQQSIEAQRQNAMRVASSYGSDPSQLSQGALDIASRVEMASQQAAAAQMARQSAEDRALALQTNMLGYGQQYGNTALASSQAAAGANAQNVNMVGMASGVGGSQLGATGQFGQLGLAGVNQAAQMRDMQFQNQMQANQFNQQNSMGAAIGGLVGTAGGIAANMYGAGALNGLLNKKDPVTGAQGGVVPDDMTQNGVTVNPPPGAHHTDQYPAVLAKDEYVVPADIVRYKGEEFFEKLTMKTREQRTQDKQQTQGVPV